MNLLEPSSLKRQKLPFALLFACAGAVVCIGLLLIGVALGGWDQLMFPLLLGLMTTLISGAVWGKQIIERKREREEEASRNLKREQRKLRDQQVRRQTQKKREALEKMQAQMQEMMREKLRQKQTEAQTQEQREQLLRARQEAAFELLSALSADEFCSLMLELLEKQGYALEATVSDNRWVLKRSDERVMAHVAMGTMVTGAHLSFLIEQMRAEDCSSGMLIGVGRFEAEVVRLAPDAQVALVDRFLLAQWLQ